MVLFKRKPVQYTTSPTIDDDEVEVWLIPQTGEIFVDYEAYLNRMDFYKQKRFICQITGHSGLTFFDALKSELAGAREVEEAFPEALKGPVLRRVQFQTISRIDNLVDLIFDEFKMDYYPGEAVTATLLNGERMTGVIRDKTRFGSKLLPDGTLSPPYSRYAISLDARPLEEAVLDDSHIMRDRKIFTKQVLRSFIKKTVTREAWTGAPWIVKMDVADRYHIDTRVPPHLRYESKMVERKQHQQQKKNGPEYDGMLNSFPGNAPAVAAAAARLPELKPAPKSHKSKHHQAQQQGQPKTKPAPFLNPSPSTANVPTALAVMPPPNFVSHTFQTKGPPPPAGPHFATFHNSTFAFAPPPPTIVAPPLPPPPPIIKYPIEDLQVPPRKASWVRPPLHYFSQDTPHGRNKHGNGIQMRSMGPLLESWDTLNVYCEIFKLDSFTFDDFVESMLFSSDDVECELFVEVHCAVLKLLVSSEADGGKVQIQLPELDEESDEDSADEDSPSPEPEPEPVPVARATRSSMARAEAEALKAQLEATREPSVEEKCNHRAAEMRASIDWIEKLRKRDFKNGGWQMILVALLHQLSKNPRLFTRCEEILDQLAPMDREPTQETARLMYLRLDVNLRIRALEIICMLTAETKAVRGYMEECSEQMTTFRKEKIQWQRDRKMALEELRLLNEERKILLPANSPPEPETTQANTPNGDAKMTDADEEVTTPADEGESEEDASHGRSLRRGQDRAAERKRKREAEQEKKDKAEAEAKMPKQSKQFIKLMKDMAKKQTYIQECEEEIATLDNDLREADCPRTRVLGKDRFWNRYYWFERNGMPYGGLPNSSTANAGYANGCIWVQGPDEMEREGYIDMKPEWQDEYKEKFEMTVPERKKLEEGSTSVYNATEWGFIDTEEALDELVSWLDIRGHNELRLKKELNLYRDKIAKHMNARQVYLHSEPEMTPPPISEGHKRTSTRTKHQPAQEDRTAHRCLLWKNNMALEELGHLHSDQPRARRPAKKIQVIIHEKEEKEKEKAEGKGRKKGDQGRGRKNGSP